MILARIEVGGGRHTGSPRRPHRPRTPGHSASSRRARSEVHDRCLWTPLATATGAAGNSTALVGTAETVAEAMADYADLGATTLLIRGYDPLADAEAMGRELIPRVRQVIADRQAARTAEAAEASTPDRR